MSSASSSKGEVEIKFENACIPKCNALRLLLIKESRKMEAMCKEFKLLKSKLQHMVGAGSDKKDGKDSALADKLETIAKGVEMWDVLESEILQHNQLLGEANKQDLGKCQEMLDAGEIIRIKLDSMIKGARNEKAAVWALLKAIDGSADSS